VRNSLRTQPQNQMLDLTLSSGDGTSISDRRYNLMPLRSA